MKEGFEIHHRKTPGTQRRSPGVCLGNFNFVPETTGGKRMYQVVALGAEAENPSLGVEGRTQPEQLDGFHNVIGRWWDNENKGLERKSIGRDSQESI